MVGCWWSRWSHMGYRQPDKTCGHSHVQKRHLRLDCLIMKNKFITITEHATSGNVEITARKDVLNKMVEKQNAENHSMIHMIKLPCHTVPLLVPRVVASAGELYFAKNYTRCMDSEMETSVRFFHELSSGSIRVL